MFLPRATGLIVLCLSVALNLFLAVRTRARAEEEQKRKADKAAAEESAAADEAQEPAVGALYTCQQQAAALGLDITRKLERVRNKVPAAKLFRLGQRNQDSEGVLGPVITELVVHESAPQRSHSVECRDIVCKVTVIEPEDSTDEQWLRRLRFDPRLRERVVSVEVRTPFPGQDPLTKAGTKTWEIFLKLWHPSGEPNASEPAASAEAPASPPPP